MRSRMMLAGAVFLLSLETGTAEIVDRIAIVVDGAAIKQSDIVSEIRVTDFLNGSKLDLSATAEKEAASRLIDQKVIAKAMESGLYPEPSQAEVDPLFIQIRQRSPDVTAYRRQLNAYGLTEETVRAHLVWQVAVLRFISLRFQIAADAASAANDESADSKKKDGDAANQQFFTWLDQQRSQARIDYKMKELK